jgi:hypothetical protein
MVVAGFIGWSLRLVLRIAHHGPTVSRLGVLCKFIWEEVWGLRPIKKSFLVVTLPGGVGFFLALGNHSK